MSADPIALLFGGMGKLGPGGDAATTHVLRSVPERRFDLVVDAGCGAGRQTLTLAGTLRTVVHGVDSHQPFLDELHRRARDAGVEHLVLSHCMDMEDIASSFGGIDLLWSEGGASLNPTQERGDRSAPASTSPSAERSPSTSARLGASCIGATPNSRRSRGSAHIRAAGCGLTRPTTGCAARATRRRSR